MNREEILKKALATYGVDEQIRMCVEEMAELTVAFSKHHRYGLLSTLNSVREEIADVEIMIRQMKMAFGEKEVENKIDYKIKRLAEMIREEDEE